MAFAQQQRKPAYRSLNNTASLSSEDFSDSLSATELSSSVQPAHHRRHLLLPSADSDTDWHVISSALPSSSSPTATTFSTKSSESAQLSPSSETVDSASYHRHRIAISDTEEEQELESYSDLDNNGFNATTSTTFLPSHDGTGTFLIDDYSDLNTITSASVIASEDDEADDSGGSSSSSQNEFTRAVNRLQFYFTEDEYDSSEAGGGGSRKEKKSFIDITKPYGGIKPPSFVLSATTTANSRAAALQDDNQNALDEIPHFQPTTAGMGSQELTLGMLSDECLKDATFLSDANNRTTTVTVTHTNAIRTMNRYEILSNKKNARTSISIVSSSSGSKYRKYNNTSRRRKNLDSIPIHHPGSGLESSASAAFLSLVWNSLRRLTNHLLENDANTMDTWSTLVSEAVFEGCMPFNSPLYMEIDNGITASTAGAHTAATAAPSYSYFAI
ncbi:hypothetical protein BDF20DRAFT_836882 [Mycotypha africana]|uniref:uncharacterized protein n=1 Tax=Mycotypha africana TaxID=64632 RepID=UPI0023002C81|nr:uncharacterized protein BDF20DRAFT_836882 [Mycotypha africana]KAI8975489.1 hypothetical protein BDF20DRAFT_836882 [Mycotypha africana]